MSIDDGQSDETKKSGCRHCGAWPPCASARGPGHTLDVTSGATIRGVASRERRILTAQRSH